MGGSGGHIVPALATRDLFYKEGIDVLLIGKGLDGHPNMSNDLIYKEVPSGAPLGLNLRKVVRHGRELWRGIQQTSDVFKTFPPDVVIGFGSYHALPALCVAVKGNIPIFLHEQNIVPGRVNRLFSRVALGVGVNFSPTKGFFKCKSEEVFLPKRINPNTNQVNNHPFICVVGGSQGAKVLNTIVPKALIRIHEDYPNLHIHHITGIKGPFEEIESLYSSKGISCCVKSFERSMLSTLMQADLVISRAGATILDEILWVKVPSILIPYPGAYGHQEDNARFFVYHVRGGDMLLQKHLNESALVHLVKLSLDAQIRKSRLDALSSFYEQRHLKSFYQFIHESL